MSPYFRLVLSDVSDPTRWHWRLFSPDDGYVADHAVRLNPVAWEFKAFCDLDNYLNDHVLKNSPLESEQGIIAEVGEWLGRECFGVIGPELLRIGQPVLLQVEGNGTQSERLTYLPWEIARFAGRSLAESGVSFVVDYSSTRRIVKDPVEGPFKVLGIFSHPEGLEALNLRKERYELADLIRQISATNGRSIQFRALQYGVTREQLRDVLLEGGGWDVVHISGHGAPGEIVLETESGTPDYLTADELVVLLRDAASRARLVTLSACNSATLVANQTLLITGLSDPSLTPIHSSRTSGVHSLATAVVEAVDCPALAMRFPVLDDFAIAFSQTFYEFTIGKGQPAARALTLSISRALTRTLANGTRSAVTPILVGRRSFDLLLASPASPSLTFRPTELRFAELPPEPARFVGRVGLIATASRILSPIRKEQTALLIHGMAGTGKTTLSLELAYTFGRSFESIVWFSAPVERTDVRIDIRGSFASFVMTLERQFVGLDLGDVFRGESQEKISKLNLLREFFESHRILILLDNLESLLTSDGSWRDPRWQTLMDCLATPNGMTRVVLASRRPLKTPDGRFVVEHVHALRLDETALLARDLPNFRKLLDGVNPDISVIEGRKLAGQLLQVVQGHPKLLEMVEARATDPQSLREQLALASDLWKTEGVKQQQFWTNGVSDAPSRGYYAVLRSWTLLAIGELPSASKLLLQVLASLPEDDRNSTLLKETWASIYEQLGGVLPAPAHSEALYPLVDHALVQVNRASKQDYSVSIHAAITQSALDEAADVVATVTADVVGAYWFKQLNEGLEGEHVGSGPKILKAAAAVLPYVFRTRRWDNLDRAAQALINRDPRPATLGLVLPYLDESIKLVTDRRLLRFLRRTRARSLLNIDIREAVTEYTDLIPEAMSDGDVPIAFGLALDLANSLLDSGDAEQALVFVNRQDEILLSSEDPAPWAHVLAAGSRAEVLVALDRPLEALEIVRRLLEEVPRLPGPTGPIDSTVTPAMIREALLNTGVVASIDTHNWSEAITYNNEVLRAQRSRGATAGEIALDRSYSWRPLVELARIDEARELLFSCRAALEAEERLSDLGDVLLSLAELESRDGHPDLAERYRGDAARLAGLA